jgi:hypothetical protein
LQGTYSYVGLVGLKDSIFQVVHISPDEQENDEEKTNTTKDGKWKISVDK